MIGHYLVTLTPEQEARVLMGKMRPGSYDECEETGPCLVGTAQGPGVWLHEFVHYWPFNVPYDMSLMWAVESQYDNLCRRFGIGRVNAAIRNRILSNQAWWALSQQREAVTV